MFAWWEKVGCFNLRNEWEDATMVMDACHHVAELFRVEATGEVAGRIGWTRCVISPASVRMAPLSPGPCGFLSFNQPATWEVRYSSSSKEVSIHSWIAIQGHWVKAFLPLSFHVSLFAVLSLNQNEYILRSVAVTSESGSLYCDCSKTGNTERNLLRCKRCRHIKKK